MKFVKLEGDAVFCYAAANAFKDGERFVELIEVSTSTSPTGYRT